MRYVCLLTAVVLIAASAFGQANISSKATFTFQTVTMCENGSSFTLVSCSSNSGGSNSQSNWLKIGKTINFKANNNTDLFVTVSAITGLYTSTQVKGSNSGTASQAVASGTVAVHVLLDGQAVNVIPQTSDSGVLFDARIQTLNATIGNVFTSCFASGGTTGTGCTLTPEQITLILETASAHSFTFIVKNVGQGVHTMDIQAQLTTSTTGTDPTNVSVSAAAVGPATIAVEQVALLDPTTGLPAQ